jgi:glycosyltransferase involved in cell wall biosynthesis
MTQTSIITAVITTFERPKLLRRAIESVQKQTMGNLSILVFDSASEDETASMVEDLAKNDPRIVYYRHPKVVSPVENYQFGVGQVKTPFFSFLADDDFLLPNFYERALFLLGKHPSAEFFLGSTIDAVLNAKPISAEARNWPDQEFYFPEEGLPHVIRSYFNWTGAVFRTKTARDLPLNAEVVPGDFDFILRLAAQHPFAFSSSPCAVFTHHPGSFSNHCGLKLIYPSLFQIADAVYKLRPEAELAFLKDAFTRSFLRKGLRVGIQNLMQRNFIELQLLTQVLRTECSGYFLGRALPFLFELLGRFSFLRYLFLKAFSCYRWLKSFKLQNHLKGHSIEL